MECECDGLFESLESSCRRFAKQGFQFGEDLLDGIKSGCKAADKVKSLLPLQSLP